MADEGIQRPVGLGSFNKAVHFLQQRLVPFADREGDVETFFSPKGHFDAQSFAGAFGKSHLVRYVDIGQALAHGLDAVGLGVHPE